MVQPHLVVRAGEREPDGRLPPVARAKVVKILLDRGFALVPSDTAYSIAAIPYSEQTRAMINALLDRENMPISLAFGSVDLARRLLVANAVADRLLSAFCPGPITVVWRAAPRRVPARFFRNTVASRNNTIGVRVPSSIVERDLAAATPYPITTVAVRLTQPDHVVTDFETAVAVVLAGSARIGPVPWCAIEGTTFYEQHSTVVEVTGDSARLRRIREGHIPFTTVEAEAWGVRQPPAPSGE